MSSDIVVEITSVPDREMLVGELWVGSHLLGEVRWEESEALLQIYPRPGGQPWEVPVKALNNAIANAANKLSTEEA